MRRNASKKPSVKEAQTRFQNRFLAALPRADARRILDASVHVDLPQDAILFRVGSVPKYAYMLTSGMASMVYTSDEGDAIEVSMFSDEGPIGWLFLLGPSPAYAEGCMLIAGSGYRIPMQTLRRIFENAPAVHARVLELTQQKALAAYQYGVCNRLHTTRQRFARWLLTTADRIQSSEFYMTQARLATVLGTRRATITEEAGFFQDAGVIEYKRGHLHILDRKALERHACSCYRVLREQYRALFQKPI